MNVRASGESPDDLRRKHMDALAAAIKACRLCPGMNIRGVTESAPGYGSIRSPVVLVGQSLCGKPCMESQIPFTGGSGCYLDRSFDSAGKGKHEVFITNVVHCHPPKNRSSLPVWVDNCSPYLRLELKVVQPRLVIGLGKDAQRVLRSLYPAQARELDWPFTATHPVGTGSADQPDLLFVPHPSWIKRQHDKALEDQYVQGLARALTWSFRGAATQI